MPDMNKFIPITKVDAERRELWGWAAIEEPDAVNEIMDYASSRPHFQSWSDAAQQRSGGKSLGNLRAMHQTTAAGKLIDFRPDDKSKGFFVGAKIVDDAEWKKVEAGVYTGFSVGGSYLKRWPDSNKRDLIRYTAKPTELSLVDAPCIPHATFQMVKADGVQEQIEFHPGNGVDTLLFELEPELGKAIPTPPTPEPLAAESLKGNLGFTLDVHHMPEPNRTIVIQTSDGKNGIPSTEELTQAAVKTQEMLNTVTALIKSLPSMIQEIVAKTVEQELNKVLEQAPTDPIRIVKVVRNP